MCSHDLYWSSCVMHYCIVFLFFYSLGSRISGQSLPPEYVKNLSSFGFFRGYRNGAVAWNGVKLKKDLAELSKKLSWKQKVYQTSNFFCRIDTESLGNKNFATGIHVICTNQHRSESRSHGPNEECSVRT